MTMVPFFSPVVGAKYGVLYGTWVARTTWSVSVDNNESRFTRLNANGSIQAGEA